jgi:C-terminal processing protease CtpA/Prc
MQSLMDARGGAPSNFAYRGLEPGIGYMDFYSMGGDYGRFKSALATMFRRLSADHVRTLIVDVRNNMGGYEQFGEELLRYVARTPYRSWSRQEVKRSPELRAQGEIAVPLRWGPFKYLVPDARRIYAGPEGTLGVWTRDSVSTPSRGNPFFSGSVCVLTGARTFSAAVILADAVKTYRLATIVGEETGGRANMTMQPVLYSLPNSKFAVSIAAGRSIRANGNADDRQGVIPDIVVKSTALDVQNGRDRVLDRARDCPRAP